MTAAAAWVGAVVVLGGDRGAAERSAAELVSRYEEPHRRYHDRRHVDAVVAGAAELAPDLPPAAAAVLALAACAHDVVYDARPGDDERASADWARSQLSAAGVGHDEVERVAALVLATLTHDGDASDPAVAALLDADLAILAAPADRYDAYAADVRQEFAAVPDDLWRAGRAHVLRSLVGKPSLFLGAGARSRWEVAARANLERELVALSG